MQRLINRFRGEPRVAASVDMAPVLATSLGVLAFAAWIGTAGEASGEAPKAADAATVSGTASVIDADTLDIHGERIRLVGVDAPESGQKCLSEDSKLVRCGSIAANALDKWINRNPVSCDVDGRDRYGRLLGECRVRGDSVQEWLVINGHALAYRSYSTAYVPAESKARSAKIGVWAGEFVEPWLWRQGLRLPGEKPTKAMISGKFASN
jgi:endonuclease YncB( thermonuclease family)